MGTSRSSAEFLAKLAALPDRLQGEQLVRVARAGAVEAERVLTASARNVAPSGRLRNVGKNGARLGVRSQQVNVGGQMRSEFVVKATGPWQLVENGTVPHGIGPRSWGGTRKARRQLAEELAAEPGSRGQVAAFTRHRRRAGKGAEALKIGGTLREYAMHPGTRGKHPWKIGKDYAQRTVPLAVAEQIRAEIRQVFR